MVGITRSKGIVFLCKRFGCNSESFLACRRAEMSWDELFSVLGWDENSWEELTEMTCEKGWDEMRRAEMRWHEVRNQIIWDEMNCGVWSASVKREKKGVKRAVWSVKKVFAWRCIAMWARAGHVLRQQQYAQSTHGPGWRTAHASSIDEKGLIAKSKATSAPPRVGATGKCNMVQYDMMWYKMICNALNITYEMWYTIYDIWAVICDMRYVMYDIWYEIKWYVTYGIWHMICAVYIDIWNMIWYNPLW